MKYITAYCHRDKVLDLESISPEFILNSSSTACLTSITNTRRFFCEFESPSYISTPVRARRFCRPASDRVRCSAVPPVPVRSGRCSVRLVSAPCWNLPPSCLDPDPAPNRLSAGAGSCVCGSEPRSLNAERRAHFKNGFVPLRGCRETDPYLATTSLTTLPSCWASSPQYPISSTSVFDQQAATA